MSGASQPPLWTWAGALAIAAIAVAGMLAMDAKYKAALIRSELNLARLDHPTPPGTRRIVVLGSSKILCALAFDQEMDDRFRRAGQPVDFTRIAVLGASPREMAASFDAVVKAHPDLVLLESDVLLLPPGGYNLNERAIEPGWQSRVRSEFKLLTGAKMPTPNNAFGAPPCDERIFPEAPPTVPQYEAALHRSRVSSPAEEKGYLAFLDALRAEGVEVGLVSIPAAPEIERIIPPGLARDRAALRDRLSAKEGLIEMTAGPLPKAYFLDRAHLNAEGREHVTGWFVTEAPKHLKPSHA